MHAVSREIRAAGIRPSDVPKRTSCSTKAVDLIAESIIILRGHRVLIDARLAQLYGVTTKRLNEQIRRNPERFPDDFIFQVTPAELPALRSQFATSKTPTGRGGRRYLPYAFTEHGAIMAAAVLNSPPAIEMSLYVVRAFVRLRALLASNKEFAKRLDRLETRIARKLAAHDESITAMLAAIRELLNPPPAKRRGIGFTADIGERARGE
jgi:hypothetical protein